jgi:hypothetical protein
MADLDTKQIDEQNVDDSTKNSSDSEAIAGVTIESLMAEIAQLKADGAKNKTALDKALKEKGEITKLYRAKQTAEEQEAEAKKEAEEQRRLAEEEKDLKIRRYESRDYFREMGMNGELLENTVEAKLNGDEATVSANIAKYYENMMNAKIKEKEIEILGSRPNPAVGVGGEESNVTKDQFNRMGYQKRVEFKQKYPELYKKYTE